MSKTTTLNLRVDPKVKSEAEVVLSKLGISMSTAIDMYLRQISLTGGIPFTIQLPRGPESINVDLIDEDEVIYKLREGLKDIKEAKGQEALSFFKDLFESIDNEEI